MSQTIHYELGEAESYLNIGTANSNLGKNDEALLLLTRSKRLFHLLTNVVLLVMPNCLSQVSLC